MHLVGILWKGCFQRLTAGFGDGDQCIHFAKGPGFVLRAMTGGKVIGVDPGDLSVGIYLIRDIIAGLSLKIADRHIIVAG